MQHLTSRIISEFVSRGRGVFAGGFGSGALVCPWRIWRRCFVVCRSGGWVSSPARSALDLVVLSVVVGFSGGFDTWLPGGF
ncbi:hypothetical protein BRADI_1g19056v3 [Brachypodium distachyon]|uniref:Uncharacterized protein n=1 Tax=Brachypodium distachyon TaxID=15368 RepID=A0A0Q3RPE2_BRADI|nr:hypothetical protein BRADI_1g19056v3 [Brachypodium distachyon]